MYHLLLLLTVFISFQTPAAEDCQTVCAVKTHSKSYGCNAEVAKITIFHAQAMSNSQISSLCQNRVSQASQTDQHVINEIQNRSGYPTQCHAGGGSWKVAHISGQVESTRCKGAIVRRDVLKNSQAEVTLFSSQHEEVVEIKGSVENTEELISCKNLTLAEREKSKAGLKCKTSNNVVWERIENWQNSGWKVSDGLTWIDGENGKFSQADASQFCIRAGGHLPSRALFQRYQEHYMIREVLNMERTEFWTSESSKLPGWNKTSGRPILGTNGTYFNGTSGEFDTDDVKATYAVACVYRKK